MPGPALILASASPRRRDLLAQAGLAPDRILATQISELPQKNETPRALAKRLALAKAEAAAGLDGQGRDAVILAADTVVACGKRILGKPADAGQAEFFLTLLSGRRHRVYTAIAVVAPGGQARAKVVATTVAFKRLAAAEIAAYISTGEWRDKAGAYAIQGRAAAFIRAINGSYTNVVGLPLMEAMAMLAAAGYRRSDAEGE